MKKKGWTSIIEVFVSILLLTGIISVIIDNQSSQEITKSEQIYEKQSEILRIIQLNDNLRESIISNQLSNEINNTINDNLPDSLECFAKICELDETCNLEELSDGEIYVKSILIFATIDQYSPKELKLFCWEN